MLYNVLVGFVFAQLHYTTKRLLPFFFWMQPFLLFFYSAFFICDSFREAEHINSEFRIPNSEFISSVSSEFARGASNVLSENTAEIVRIAEAAPHCYLSNR